ncbi:sulfotransferase family protein [Cohnella faecalis]|uniref:Sulfotransferase n=1 Tax=Cohnella faecalis TaxID=2315694 RepID=A0A398CH26_9BACL|nr:sulfotransferase [Cohnella faecalis]RIE01770.1 sulfotransferase [Cohnella faecalis]
MSDGESIIFLLSVPRSGSSLTTAILNNHPDVFAAPESWLLMKLNDLLLPLPNKYGGEKIFQTFINGIMGEALQEEAMRAFVDKTYHGLASANGATLFLDKSPRYYTVLELLDRLFPASKRIWLIRNPLSVVASYKMLDVKRGTPFSEKLFKQKEFSMRVFDLTYGYWRYYHYFHNSSSEQVYRLSYEKLTEQPLEETVRLCTFLNIPYIDRLERYGERRDEAKKALLTASHSGDPYVWKHNEPHQASVDLWKTELSSEEIAAYMNIMGTRLFEELGYGQVVAEAERITGTSFPREPDEEWLKMRHDQWLQQFPQPIPLSYNIKIRPSSNELSQGSTGPTISARPTTGPATMEVNQLKVALRASELKRERIEMDLEKLKRRNIEIKRRIPFYSILAPIVRRILLKKH